MKEQLVLLVRKLDELISSIILETVDKVLLNSIKVLIF